MKLKQSLRVGLLSCLGGVALSGMPGAASAQSVDQLAQADSNGDDSVTQQELVGAPTPRFDSADKDKNGVLSSQEMAALRASAG